MGNKTSISWTDYTFNPWWGCEKVSPACAHCYAEVWARRCGLEVWGGASSGRRFFGEKHWGEPVRWNEMVAFDCPSCAARHLHGRKAVKGNPVFCGCKPLREQKPCTASSPRVFCASMGDVFEDRADLEGPRRRLLQLIDDTPHLDWLLLTKRPQKVRTLLERASNGNVRDFRHMPNVWLGVTVENQAMADVRIPLLLTVEAKVRFVSMEPLLEAVDLRRWTEEGLECAECSWRGSESLSSGQKRYGDTGPDDREYECPKCGGPCAHTPLDELLGARKGVHWVIVGGESGGKEKRRPFEMAWLEGIARQCEAAGIPLHVKQDAGPVSGLQGRIPEALWGRKEFPRVRGERVLDKEGAEVEEMPEEVRTAREWRVE